MRRNTPTTIIEDDPEPPDCHHPDHNPPGHIVIPAGKRLRHTCPACGHITLARPIVFTLSVVQ